MKKTMNRALVLCMLSSQIVCAAEQGTGARLAEYLASGKERLHAVGIGLRGALGSGKEGLRNAWNSFGMGAAQCGDKVISKVSEHPYVSTAIVTAAIAGATGYGIRCWQDRSKVVPMQARVAGDVVNANAQQVDLLKELARYVIDCTVSEAERPAARERLDTNPGETQAEMIARIQSMSQAHAGLLLQTQEARALFEGAAADATLANLIQGLQGVHGIAVTARDAALARVIEVEGENAGLVTARDDVHVAYTGAMDALCEVVKYAHAKHAPGDELGAGYTVEGLCGEAKRSVDAIVEARDTALVRATTAEGENAGLVTANAAALARVTAVEGERDTAVAAQAAATAISSALAIACNQLTARARLLAGRAGEATILSPTSTVAAINAAKDQGIADLDALGDTVSALDKDKRALEAEASVYRAGLSEAPVGFLRTKTKRATVLANGRSAASAIATAAAREAHVVMAERARAVGGGAAGGARGVLA